jgi:hypothetical protein
LVHRVSGVGKEKIYDLSKRGQEKLEWLEGQFEDEEPVERARAVIRWDYIGCLLSSPILVDGVVTIDTVA